MILVTGGAGYIGSHTVIALKEAGFRTVVADDLSRGHEELVFSDYFEEGDLKNYSFIDSVLKKYPLEAVIHFAASSLVGESMEKPEDYYYNNITGSLNLLRAMRINGIDKIVFSSTAAVYGEPSICPIKEDHDLNPTNVYGDTKFFIEKMLSSYNRAYGLNSIAFRYFNAAGADPGLRTGEDHDPETHLIPIVLDVLSRRRETLSVFGNDYPTRDGTCIRDYIHVTDLADAHTRGLRKLMEGWKGPYHYNLGNGKGYSVLEIIRAAEQVTGLNIRTENAPPREGDPAVLVASSERAERDLGWERKFADINSIIETAWKWHLKRFKIK